MVPQPIDATPKPEAGNFSTSASQPPALSMHRGSRMKIRPTVFIRNWTISVSVSDHMPPMAEYTTTTPPPSTMAIQTGRPNSTCSTVPIAMTEVAASISA
ncbi:hypothetical protein D9M68_893650 [compost metagenome]